MGIREKSNETNTRESRRASLRLTVARLRPEVGNRRLVSHLYSSGSDFQSHFSTWYHLTLRSETLQFYVGVIMAFSFQLNC